MKILMALIATLSLAGCSSFDDRVNDMHKINSVYCNGEGFKSYAELSKSNVGTCKSGMPFRVRM
jgi:hypothetical protein